MLMSVGIQCATISLVIGREKVIYEGSKAYEDFTKDYFSAFESALSPHCVVLPTSTQDVSKLFQTIQTFRTLGVCKESFAVKGGGHTPFAGSVNIEDGITIDLGALNSVQVSDDRKTTSVGAGGRWKSVYDILVPQGLAVAGGRVSKVGVGGLVLGGGISYFSNKRGFVCDNVINFEVVLASGQVINANAREHSDLWRALKGGSSNFGVVTRFDLHTFGQGPIWGGSTYYDPSTWPKHLDAIYDYTTSPCPDEYAHVISSYGYGQGAYVAAQLVYSTNGQENPPSLQPFTSIPAASYSDTRIANISSYADEQAAFTADGLRHRFTTTTVQPNRDFYTEASHLWNETLSDIKNVTGLGYSLVFQALHMIMTSRGAANGRNSLGLEGDKNLQLILFAAFWDDPADDERVIKAQDTAAESIQKAAKMQGLGSDYVYLNYASENQSPFAGYGPDSVERLKEVAKKYDPTGVFQEVIPGGFKLQNS